jgi:membrane glycosyltransferase
MRHAGGMLLQRLAFATVALLAAAGLTALLASVLAPGGWTPAKILLLACFLGAAPWLGICAGNGLIGFLIRILARDPARAVLPVRGDIDSGPITARTAIAVTIRNESMDLVLPPLARLYGGLADPAHFSLFILSDTQDPALAAAEEKAIAVFPHPVRYRRRTDNAGFKAGNVMDFLDHHAGGCELAVMLDADSEMTPVAVRRLVRIMQVAPCMGIVQHLTVGQPAASAFPRLFQFGMRAGMRVWATGQAWWQGDEGPYWGHNAIIRVAAFRQHCRLPSLPDGSAILSHDQVEAACMRAAGWGVAVWTGEEGSLEQNPPTLPDFLHRDARWLAGNFQYRHLLRLPGLRPMGRRQLVQAMLLFAGAPLYTAMLALAALNAAIAGAETPLRLLAALTLAWTFVIYSPKLLGYAEVLSFPARRARYGGAARFAAGAAAEVIFTLLLDALSQPSKTLAMLRRRRAWLPQNRDARGVGWTEAVRLFWPHTLFGLLVFALFAASSWRAALWAFPFAGGLPLSIPFCVLTARPAFSAWLRRIGLAATPEELPASAEIRPREPALSTK